MSNFKKSFSFRSGVQVDDDNFIVTTNGTVGIGTTVPTQFLDVRGNATISGFVTASSVFSSGISTFSRIHSGSGIIIDGSTGIITATAFYGDGATLSNLPTSQWIDVNQPGLGFTSIYAQGNVGIATTNPNPVFALQVGLDPLTSNGVGINSRGDVYASGIITATSFDGTLNVDDLSGVIGDDHLPDLITSNINTTSGFSTFNNVTISSLTVNGTLTGNLTGIASTAQTLTGTPNINVGVTTATRIKVNNIGIGTDNPLKEIQIGDVSAGGYSIDNNVTVITEGKIGIGTTNPLTSLELYNSGNNNLNIWSGSSGSSLISLGSTATSKGELKYDSSTNVLSLKNFSGNGVQIDVTTTGGNSGGLVFRRDNTRVFGITNEGKVSINKSSDPADNHSLEVIGSAKVGGGSSVMGSLTINAGTAEQFVITGSNTKFPIDPDQNLFATSGISTFNDVNINGDGINVVGSSAGNTIGIGTTTVTFSSNSVNIDVVDLNIGGPLTIGGSFNVSAANTSEIITKFDTLRDFDAITGIGSTTHVDFTVPVWAKEINILFSNVALGIGTTGHGFMIQLNEETSGYNGASLSGFSPESSYSAGQLSDIVYYPGEPLAEGFLISDRTGLSPGTSGLASTDLSKTISGIVKLCLLDKTDISGPQEWISSGTLSFTDTDRLRALDGIINLAGTKSISNHLDTITIRSDSSLSPNNKLVGGKINVTYKP